MRSIDVRVSEEPNVDLLRRKAEVLETENERLSKRVTALLRENLALKGMAADQIALNLPGLLSRVTSSGSSSLTKPGSERRATKTSKAGASKKPQTGHGPTEQTNLEVVRETLDLDEADKQCPKCGGGLEHWEGQDDEVEIVDIIERQWIVRRCTLKKYRCRCGDCIETADGPPRLIKGGRYSPDVAISAAVGKYVDHLPLERQVGQAGRIGALLTSQALWDQIEALSEHIEPVVAGIKELLLAQPVLGVDESPFKLIEKGGSKKWQAWQLAAPVGAYFEILRAKSAEMGSRLLGTYAGEVIADGAKAYESLARAGPFNLANCWSHTRRQVLKAEGEAPGQVAEFLDMVAELYAIERKAADEPEPGDDRPGYRHRIDEEVLRRLRDTESRAVIERIQSWILDQHCIPGGQLKKSLEYVAKRWTALNRFLDNPLIPLDTNHVERGYIGMAIGRRNYVGARSIDGAKVAARFYTVFETCKRVGVEPHAYLRYATYALLAGDRPSLPHEWDGQS